MNYLDLNGYVKMIRLNKNLNKYIETWFGEKHLFTQYNTFLNKYQNTEQGVKMFRQYAIFLGVLPFPDYVDIKQFTLPLRKNIILRKYPSQNQVLMNLRYDAPKLVNNTKTFKFRKESDSWNELIDKEVPTVIAVLLENRMEFMIQIDQWKCEHIEFEKNSDEGSNIETTTITFVPKTEENTHNQVVFKYRGKKRLPYYVKVKFLSLVYMYIERKDFEIHYQNGYYQEATTGECARKLMLFYNPFQYQPHNSICVIM